MEMWLKLCGAGETLGIAVNDAAAGNTAVNDAAAGNTAVSATATMAFLGTGTSTDDDGDDGDDEKTAPASMLTSASPDMGNTSASPDMDIRSDIHSSSGLQGVDGTLVVDGTVTNAYGTRPCALLFRPSVRRLHARFLIDGAVQFQV